MQLGGLLSYGADIIDLNYLRGLCRQNPQRYTAGRPPVEQPTKYELFINLKTAKALGIEIPATLLARADEVIE